MILLKSFGISNEQVAGSLKLHKSERLLSVKITKKRAFVARFFYSEGMTIFSLLLYCPSEMIKGHLVSI